MTASPLAVSRLDADFRWPGSRRIGIVFNIAFEGWSDGKAPGIGPMGNPLPAGVFDTNALSWATFGAVRGVQRLLRIAARNDLATSVMVNGVLAERHPDIVRAIAGAGHEIVAHSWGMDVIPATLDAAAERANIARTSDILERVVGARPTGWISPRGTGSLASSRLLAEAGYRWQGDCNDDDLPYVERFADDSGGAASATRAIVAIPLTMDVNDLPHYMRFGNEPAQLVSRLQDILDHALAADDTPFLLDVTAHAHVFGRTGGAWAFDAAMALAKSHPDVWIGTRAQICDMVLAQVA